MSLVVAPLVCLSSAKWVTCHAALLQATVRVAALGGVQGKREAAAAEAAAVGHEASFPECLCNSCVASVVQSEAGLADQVVLGELLGRGAFGKVYAGVCRHSMHDRPKRNSLCIPMRVQDRHPACRTLRMLSWANHRILARALHCRDLGGSACGCQDAPDRLLPYEQGAAQLQVCQLVGPLAASMQEAS